MKKKIYYFVGIVLLINFLQAFFTPITEDEAYYWLWSQNLDWGYFDHPPMVAWWAAVGYEIFQNELGFRLISTFFSGMSVYLLYQLLKPKTQKEFNLFGILIGSTLVFHVYGFITTPDAPLLFSTILYLYSLKNFLEKNNFNFTILLAISFAGLVYSKYHGILVILFTIFPIIKTWWRNPKFYAAVLLSLMLFTPHFVWLFQNDFIPIQYHFIERSSDESFEFGKLFTYLLIFFLGASPLLSYYIFNAIFKFKSKNAFEKSVWCLAILPGIFFFITVFKDKVQPQWLLISFVAMIILTYEFYKFRENNLLIKLGISSIILILILRISIIIPSISPLYIYKNFALKLKDFQLEHAVFEKYQEASVYLFYNPNQKATTHRTIGNRKNQFTLWNWEENFLGQTVDYVSPWVQSDRSFIGGHKNYEYFIKSIPNYQTYHLIGIETIDKIETEANQLIDLTIKIHNAHERPIEIGENSDLKLNITYYQGKQYNFVYSTEIPIENLILRKNESKEIDIQFRNIDKKGNFKASVGIHYSEIGTTYLSKPIDIFVK